MMCKDKGRYMLKAEHTINSKYAEFGMDTGWQIVPEDV